MSCIHMSKAYYNVHSVSRDLRNETKGELPWPSNTTGTLCDGSNGCPCDSGETYNITSSSDNRIGPETWATTKCALNGLQTVDLLNVSHVSPTQTSWASNRTNTELMPNISSHWVSSTGSLEVTTTYNSTEEENSTMYYDRMELNSTSGPDINDKEAGTSTQWPSDGLKTKDTNSAWSRMAATLRASTSSTPAETLVTMAMQAIAVNTSTVPPMATSGECNKLLRPACYSRHPQFYVFCTHCQLFSIKIKAFIFFVIRFFGGDCTVF